jgi:hypothetical protein
VAHSPLLGWALRKGTAGLEGSVHVQSASLGWFSPISATGIEVRDGHDHTVLQASYLTGETRLLGLLLKPSSPGKFRLDRPKLAVQLRPDGSNVEDLLAKYLTGPSGGPVDFALEIVDGSVTVTDQETRQSWQIENLQLALSTTREPGSPMKLETSAEVADIQHPGRLSLKLATQSGNSNDASAQASGTISLEAEALPLAMFQRLAARMAPQTRLEGSLSSKVEAQWGGPASTTIQADVTAEGFVFATRALGNDELRLDRARAACRGTVQGRRVEIQKSSVECDVGAVEAVGVWDLGGNGPGGLANAILRQTFDLNARIDLARLARLLPGTLRIRQGTEITSGQVALRVSSRRQGGTAGPGATTEATPDSAGKVVLVGEAGIVPVSPAPPASPHPGPLPKGEGSGMSWQAQLEVNELTASNQGRQVRWDKPIQCVVAAHETADGPVLDSLRCASDFVNLQAAGTPEKLAASLSFNLQQLADQLGRFVDLSGVTMTGEGWANLNWNRTANPNKAATGGRDVRSDGQVENLPHAQSLACEVQLRKFQIGVPGRAPWAEDELALTLAVQGGTNLWTDRRVQTAELHVKAGPDQLDAKLLQPVVDPQGAWPLEVQAQGQLERWPARLRSFVTLDPWRFSGPFQLGARVTLAAGAIAFQQAQLHVAPLVMAGPSLNVNEPNADLTASGVWDFGRSRCQLDSASLTTASLSAMAKDIVYSAPANGPWELAGNIEYRGDLDRLRSWFASAPQPPTWRMMGQLNGTAQLQPSAGQLQARTAATVLNFAMLSPGQQFQEPRIHLTAQGSYQPQSGLLRIDQCELTSSMLKGKAAGQLGQKQNQADAQVTGEVAYDWAQICGLLRPWTGTWLQVTGRGNGPVSYRGPLSLAGAEATASAKWDSARIAGFPLGPSQLKARLANGVLQAEPIKVACSQGQLTLAPSVRLSPEPMELTLARGPVAQRVQIDPAMCQAGLKYVAPVLADVAAAQGAFSIELDDCRLPLADVAKGEMTGRLTIHSVEVGPGPLVRELATLLNHGNMVKIKKENVVPFRMTQGRVYHQNLELEFPDVTVRTYGSVGIANPQTLAVMLEMPVPPKWIGNNALGNALKNKVIKLPLGGTLKGPQIDRKELANINRELVGGAARNVLQGEVNKGLERLFGTGK